MRKRTEPNEGSTFLVKPHPNKQNPSEFPGEKAPLVLALATFANLIFNCNYILAHQFVKKKNCIKPRAAPEGPKPMLKTPENMLKLKSLKLKLKESEDVEVSWHPQPTFDHCWSCSRIYELLQAQYTPISQRTVQSQAAQRLRQRPGLTRNELIKKWSRLWFCCLNLYLCLFLWWSVEESQTILMECKAKISGRLLSQYYFWVW